MLDSGNLDAYGLQLASIGSALTAIGDILLYGCNVAQGGVGMQFISLLAQITGADVTASDDLTGNDNLNGDWELEQATGGLDAIPLFGSHFAGLLQAPPTVGFKTNNASIVEGN